MPNQSSEPELDPIIPDNVRRARPMPEASATLQRTRLLDSAGLYIDLRLSLLVCNTCQHIVHPQKLSTHWREVSAHQEEARSVDGTRTIQAHLESLGVPFNVPDYASSTVPSMPVEGIDIFTVYGCSACPKHAKFRHRMNAHCRDCPREGACVVTVYVQRPRQECGYVRVLPRRGAPVDPVVRSLVERYEESVTALTLDHSNARLINPLLRRTQWHAQVKPFDRDALLHHARFPSAPEREFGDLVLTVTQYYERALGCLPSTDELVLQLVNTSEPERNGVNHTPIHEFDQNHTTLPEYSRLVANVIAILLRKGRTGAFPVPSSPSLDSALERLRLSLCVRKERSIMSVHDVLTQLWFTEWRRTRPAQALVDPTMAALTLLSLKPDGSFLTAQELTKPLAKLTRAIQLTVIFEVQTCMTEGQGNAGDQLAIADGLLKYVQEARMTTFSSIRSLQHYATALCHGSLSVPRIWWVDNRTYRVLLYSGNRLTLDNVRAAVAFLQAEIIAAWRSVTLGKLDDVCYEDLADDLRNVRNGYTAADPLRPGVRARFEEYAGLLFASPVFSLVSRDTGEVIAVQAKKWLHAVARLEQLLMIGTHLGSGGPARGTELVSMTYRNTPERVRNFYIFDCRPCFLRQYNKTTNLFQRDKVIPNSFDAVVGAILTTHLVHNRPIAAFLAPTAFPELPQAAGLYGTMMFVNFGKLFTSIDLSRGIVTAFSRVLPWSLSLRAWRHIYIAIAREHLRLKAQDIDDAEEVDANQAGHSASTSREKYAISENAFDGADENAIRQFFDNSDHWCKLVGLVPGGLGLAHMQAKVDDFESVVHRPPTPQLSPSTGSPGCSNDDQALAAMSLMRSGFEELSSKLDLVMSAQGSQEERLIRIEAHLADLSATVNTCSRAHPNQQPGALPAATRTRSPARPSLPSSWVATSPMTGPTDSPGGSSWGSQILANTRLEYSSEQGTPVPKAASNAEKPPFVNRNMLHPASGELACPGTSDVRVGDARATASLGHVKSYGGPLLPVAA
ncbi:hypothetical protein EV122DRAFT_284983 [Schizophyllum commune]